MIAKKNCIEKSIYERVVEVEVEVEVDVGEALPQRYNMSEKAHE